MIGNGVSINRMYSVTRNRETIYGEYIFKYHPDFKDVPQYYSRYNTFHIEGGDILNINDHVLAVGISQRTEPDAIDAVGAEHLRRRDQPHRHHPGVQHPEQPRAFMHLDTVFTQIDTDKFTVHPGIMGPLTVFEIDPGRARRHQGPGDDRHAGGHPRAVRRRAGASSSPAAAATVSRPSASSGTTAPTRCASAPGTVVVYERNDVTNKVLERSGIKLVVIPSAELSRGRGGPRCMSMPIWRED